jgi:hypothetical protein
MDFFDSLRDAIEGSGTESFDIARFVKEINDALHQILDTVLLQTMVHDVIHEGGASKMETMDVSSRPCSSAYLEAGNLYPMVKKPNPFPSIIVVPQVLKCVHLNAMSNSVMLGKRTG